jgi:hypothetical protein
VHGPWAAIIVRRLYWILAMQMLALLGTRTSFRTALRHSFTRCWTTRDHGSCRSYLTEAIEPPLDGDVPERPCILILAEDVGILTDASTTSSWHGTFAAAIPKNYGIPYVQWSLSSELPPSLNLALGEMKADLADVQQPVLVARGPWISWMAQFYLESLPLSGLVMVDPLQFNETAACRHYEDLYRQRKIKPPEYGLFQEYVNHWDHWSLKLEPGAIPMMVLSTQPGSEMWTRHARATAARHSSAESPNGQVPVVKIDASDTDDCMRKICNWIEEEVL